MNGMEAAMWIISVCVGLRKSQSKTLGDLVSVAVRIGRVSLAELGRLLAEERDGFAKHQIKRAWRFTANGRVHISDAMQGRCNGFSVTANGGRIIPWWSPATGPKCVPFIPSCSRG